MRFYFHDMCFHAESGVLEKGTDTLTLRPKTAQVLQILLENPLSLVPKEEIMEQVWSESHVTQGILVQSIQELRRVLEDDARNPKFIKTYSRRGYQWLCEVKKESPNVPSFSRTGRSESNNKHTDTIESYGGPQSRRKIYFVLLVPFILLALWVFWPGANFRNQPLELGPEPDFGPKVRWATLPFENLSKGEGNDWLATSVYNLVLEGLRSNENFSVVQPIELYRALSGLNLDGPSITEETAKTLLARLNADFLLKANLQKPSNLFSIKFEVFAFTQNNLKGEVLFSDPIKAARMIGSAISSKSGISFVNHHYSLNEQANEDYLRGLRALENTGVELAERYFQAALLQDPFFEKCRLALARAHYLRGELNGAQKLFEEVLNHQEVGPPNELGIGALIGLSKCSMRLGRLSSAMDSLKIAVTQASGYGFPKEEVHALRLLGTLAMGLGNWKQHDEFEQRANTVASAKEVYSDPMDRVFYLGATQAVYQDYEQNLQLMLAALEHYQQLHHKPALADTYLALAFNRQRSLDDKHRDLRMAEVIFEELGYSLVTPSVWEARGFVFAQELKPLSFRDCYLKAMERYKGFAAKGDLANSQYYLALAEVMCGTFSKGIELEVHFKKAEHWLDVCHKFYLGQGNSVRLGSEKLLRGTMALYLGNYRDSRNYFELANSKFTENEFPEGLLATYVAIANTYLNDSKWDEAISFLDKAKALGMKRDSFWLPYALFAYFKSNNCEEACALIETYIAGEEPFARKVAEQYANICKGARNCKSGPIPDPPHLVEAYFRSF